MNNTDKLKAIIAKHQLSRQQVADNCGVSRYTVDGWLYGHQPVRDQYIELLTLKLNR